MRPQRPHLNALVALAASVLLMTSCAHQQITPEGFGDVYERRPDAGSSIDQSRVLLLEFTDFECSFCARSQDTIDALLKQYGDQLTVVTLHNPLPFHKNARTLAKLAVVAQRQGKFKSVKRHLFTRYEEGVTEAKVQAELQMNDAEFESALSSEATAQRVEHQRRLANAVGFRGTPQFSINGHKVAGAKPIQEFSTYIDAEIAAAKETDAQGQAWLKSRFKENAPDLHAYLFEGKEPPEVAPRKKKPSTDHLVYYVPVDHENDAVFGPRDARVTVVTFTGFECPYSKRIYPLLTKLQEEYPHDVRIHIKHKPLPFHENSRATAEAALCAREQGKFTEMADLLFERQGQLAGTRKADNEPVHLGPGVHLPEEDPPAAEPVTTAVWRQLAGEVGLNVNQFATCMSEGKYDGQIDHDLLVASEAEVVGSPHTFVNGRSIRGAQPWKNWSALVDKELAAAQAILAESGLRGEALKARVLGLYEELISTGQRKRAIGSKSHDLRRADKSDPIRNGSANAKLKLTVFTDYRCRFCAKIEPVLDQVKAHFGDDLAVEFRHYPLPFHPLAEPAARAAQCAHEAGRGLEMHRLLMERQLTLGHETWSSFAKEVGAPLDAFEACMFGDRAKSQVADDRAIGERAGLKGTPTLYLHMDGINGGGRLFSPESRSLQGIVSAIERYLSLEDFMKKSSKSEKE